MTGVRQRADGKWCRTQIGIYSGALEGLLWGGGREGGLVGDAPFTFALRVEAVWKGAALVSIPILKHHEEADWERVVGLEVHH